MINSTFFFSILSTICIAEAVFPIDTSFKYNDTTKIPFIDPTYFSNQHSENQCLKLIDFRNYRPFNAKKYLELFRIVLEIDSRPVSFEIGLNSDIADVVIKFPNRTIAAGQCKDTGEISITTKLFGNVLLKQEQGINDIVNCIQPLKPSVVKLVSTARLKIEYFDLHNHYYFEYDIYGTADPKSYDIMCSGIAEFIAKRPNDHPVWLSGWAKEKLKMNHNR